MSDTFLNPKTVRSDDDETERLRTENTKMRLLLADMRKWMNSELGDWDKEYIDRIDELVKDPAP